jgi:hypothetical protein
MYTMLSVVVLVLAGCSSISIVPPPVYFDCPQYGLCCPNGRTCPKDSSAPMEYHPRDSQDPSEP